MYNFTPVGTFCRSRSSGRWRQQCPGPGVRCCPSYAQDTSPRAAEPPAVWGLQPKSSVLLSCVCTMYHVESNICIFMYMYIRRRVANGIHNLCSKSSRQQNICVYAQIINSIKLVKFQPCVYWKSVALMYICICTPTCICIYM